MVNEQKQRTPASVSFKTEFAVDMTCQSCVSAVKKALSSIEGIDDYDIDLEKKQVVVTGRAPPSKVTRALKGTGRQILIRGSGTAAGNHDGAAVSILESPLPVNAYATTSSEETQKVHGIARLVQVSTSPVLSLLDLTVRFPGYPLLGGSPRSPTDEEAFPSYTLYVSKTGDLTNLTAPPYSTGSPLHTLTTLRPDNDGYADAFLELPIPIWEMVGRAMVVERTKDLQARLQEAETRSNATEDRVKAVIGSRGRLGVLAGVIARSAGVWGNDKTICACSGKTMWEEGRTMEKTAKV